jgi:hypothetical protein
MLAVMAQGVVSSPCNAARADITQSLGKRKKNKKKKQKEKKEKKKTSKYFTLPFRNSLIINQ